MPEIPNPPHDDRVSTGPARPQKRRDDPRAFYVVWSPEGGDPVVRFPSFAQARNAAWRLSERHPAQSFFVLKSCWGRPARPPEAPEDGGPPSPSE